MLSVWLRAIRVRFLLASVISVFVALALSWRQNATLDVFDALLTLAGVVALHISVDLLNDYWDFKRGIDTATDRTKMSGGTGVLPEGLLSPSAVYRGGITSLIAGAAIGSYFVVTHGIIIAAILGFAVLSIYFYSTKIVDSGLGEFFVAVKGCMIVLGAFFIQSGQLTADAVHAGIAIGALSSLVLFITSFPDYEADKAKGRRTLVIAAGRERAVRIFWVFPSAAYGSIVAGVAAGVLPWPVLVTLAGAPLLVGSWRGLARHYDSAARLVPSMSSTLMFSRVTGGLLVAGIMLSGLCARCFQ